MVDSEDSDKLTCTSSVLAPIRVFRVWATMSGDEIGSKLSFLHLWDSWDVVNDIGAKSRKTTEYLTNIVFKDQVNFSSASAKMFSKQSSSALGNHEIGSFQVCSASSVFCLGG